MRGEEGEELRRLFIFFKAGFTKAGNSYERENEIQDFSSTTQDREMKGTSCPGN